jgi:hypothetical protein
MEKPNSPYSLAVVGEKEEEINHQYKKKLGMEKP